LKENLSDKKLLDNTTYKKLSILSDEMLTFKDIVDAKKKKLKDEGKEDSPEYRQKIYFGTESEKYQQCTFPRRGYPMENDSKWRSKNDSGLKFYVRKDSGEGFEKGTIMIKDPEKWYDWQIRALYIMYPDYKDVMPVLVKKHLADWGIPSSPLERGDMRNKEEAFINHLIRTVENDQPSFERMDSSISGGESKNQTDDEKPLNTELKTLLWAQKNVDESIVKLKQKLAKAEESSKKLKDKIKKKQKEQKKEKKKEERRKKINELAAELERLKRLNEEDEDSSDEELEEIEVEEPDFPGEDEIEEFEHESLNKWEDIDFYKDDDDNVWDENKEFVGTYDDDDNTISFKEDYEPEE
jgi:hypothetical protein